MYRNPSNLKKCVENTSRVARFIDVHIGGNVMDQFRLHSISIHLLPMIKHHTHTHTHTHTNTHAYIHIHTQRYTYTHTNAYTLTHTHTCVHKDIHTHTHTNIHMYTHIRPSKSYYPTNLFNVYLFIIYV